MFQLSKIGDHYTIISEHVGFGQNLSVDRSGTESKMFIFLSMCSSNVCELPKTFTTIKLAEHKNQHVTPMRHRPASRPIVIFGEDSSELFLRKKQGYLCENKFSYMHICSDFESGAKIRISKPGHKFSTQNLCA